MMIPYSDEMILTINHRLASHLITQYDRDQTKKGKTVWLSPSISPLDEWLKSLWLENRNQPKFLLTPYQERILWTQVIKEKKQGFFHSDSLVPLIQQAYQFLNQWNIPLSRIKEYPGHEASFFGVKCAEAFEQICKERHLIVFSQLIPALMEEQVLSPDRLPAKIFLAGFGELYPQLADFFKFLEKKWNITQEIYSPASKKAEAFRVGFTHLSDEVLHAAYWAKEQQRKFPEKTIGCVFLNLSEIQKTVKRTFNRVLGDARLFNLSLGQSLSEYPIIKAALWVFSFMTHSKIELEMLRKWLYSPFFVASEEEMISRCELGARLSQQGAHFLDLEQLLSLLSNAHSLKLASALKQFLEQSRHIEKQVQLPSVWSSWLMKQLQILGWPGERALNEEECLCVERFWQALEEFNQLDDLGYSMTVSEAFQSLSEGLKMILFQSASSCKNSIQVMGLLEASGLEFDHLWISGMSEENWPAKPRPNPFIPLSLQKSVGMPHASAEKELAFSHRLTHDFFQRTDHLTLSYSASAKDFPVLPSPLIKCLKEISLKDLPDRSVSFPDDACEMLPDTQDIPIRLGEVIQGGTAILKHQAACSFKAFAQIRLRAAVWQKASFGLSLLDRGHLVHRILENFWRHTKKQCHLLLMDEESLKKNLEKIILKNLSDLIQEKPGLKLEGLWVKAEKQRLEKLIIQWLEYEKKREDFEVVALEKGLEVNFEGINLSVKMDRIDRLANGSYAIIDYKTGKVASKPWEGNRPDEPQLPFYWLMSSSPVEAVVFAQIHPEAFKFKGVSQNAGVLPHVGTIKELFKESPEMSWDDLKTYWRNILKHLMIDFCVGGITLNPKKGKETCESCGLQMLCRIHEQPMKA